MIYGKSTIVFVAMLALVWCSCNPYKQLAQRPPLTTKDSAALLSRCIKIVPIDTLGNVVYISYPDSSEYWKTQVKTTTTLLHDSFTDVQTKYHDTCTSAIATYQDGLRRGYNNGYSNAKSEDVTKIKQQLHDCDSIHNTQTNKLKQAYNFQVLSSQANERVAVDNENKYRGKMDFWKTWAIIASCAALLFLLICVLLWKFRKQARAANNIINDVKGLK